MNAYLIFYLGAVVGSLGTFCIVALFSIGQVSEQAYRASGDLVTQRFPDDNGGQQLAEPPKPG